MTLHAFRPLHPTRIHQQQQAYPNKLEEREKCESARTDPQHMNSTNIEISATLLRVEATGVRL